MIIGQEGEERVKISQHSADWREPETIKEIKTKEYFQQIKAVLQSTSTQEIYSRLSTHNLQQEFGMKREWQTELKKNQKRLTEEQEN